jgi:DNA repair protein RadC
LTDALKLVDIRVLDHVVVATEGSVSLADRNLL